MGLIPACGTSGSKPLFCPKNTASRGLGAYMIVRAKGYDYTIILKCE